MKNRNKHNLILSVLLILLALPLGAILAQEPGTPIDPDGALWTVTWTDIPPELNLILVHDTMRLMFHPQEKMVQLKPLPPLMKRWGQTGTYKAMLKQDPSESKLYCGKITVRSPHGQGSFDHDLSLSVVSDGFAILDFNDSNECTYHDSHGGTAHIHR